MPRLLKTLVLAGALTSPFVQAQNPNVFVYNYSTSRVVVHLNYQWNCQLDPQEYRGFRVPWDEMQVFDFFRYPSGNPNNTYQIKTWVTKWRSTEEIRIYDKDLPQ